MKFLVTGAASFIGRELHRQCASRGIEVFGIDIVADGSDTVRQGDIRDPDLAAILPDDIDAVVHLAAVARDADCKRDRVLCYDVNVAGTANVFRAAHAKGVRQFIYASTEWVYDRFDPDVAKREDEPIDPLALTSDYALSKFVGEAVLRQCHLSVGTAITVLRFGIIYGPRHDNWSAVESLLAKVAAGEPVQIGSGRTARGFVYVSDIARAILCAVGRTGFETYNIQADRPVTLREVIEASAAILGRPCDLIETDPAKPSIRSVSADLAHRELGWRPETSLEEGLTDVARFLGFLPQKRAGKARCVP
jgi:UDP-glucose 4-epimerase